MVRCVAVPSGVVVAAGGPEGGAGTVTIGSDARTEDDVVVCAPCLCTSVMGVAARVAVREDERRDAFGEALRMMDALDDETLISSARLLLKG